MEEDFDFLDCFQNKGESNFQPIYENEPEQNNGQNAWNFLPHEDIETEEALLEGMAPTHQTQPFNNVTALFYENGRRRQVPERRNGRYSYNDRIRALEEQVTFLSKALNKQNYDLREIEEKINNLTVKKIRINNKTCQFSIGNRNCRAGACAQSSHIYCISHWLQLNSGKIKN